VDRNRKNGGAGFERQPGGSLLKRLKPSIRRTASFGKDHQGFSASQHSESRLVRAGFRVHKTYRKGTQPAEHSPGHRDSEDLVPGHKANRAAHRDPNPERIEVSHMVRRNDKGAVRGYVPETAVLDAKENTHRAHQESAEQPYGDRVTSLIDHWRHVDP